MKINQVHLHGIVGVLFVLKTSSGLPMPMDHNPHDGFSSHLYDFWSTPFTASYFTPPATPSQYGIDTGIDSDHATVPTYHQPEHFSHNHNKSPGRSFPNPIDSPMNMIWNNHTPDLHLEAADRHDNLETHSTSGTESPHIPHMPEDHHGNVPPPQSAMFSGRTMPSDLERHLRYVQYNKFEWQRNLHESDLEDIYTKISSTWPPFPESTLKNAFNKINEALNREPQYVLPILEGNEEAILHVFRQVSPRKRHPSRGPSPRPLLTMAIFLARHRGEQSDRINKRPSVEIGTIHDSTGKAVVTWAPDDMNSEDTDKFFLRFKRYLRIRKDLASARLSICGPLLVSQFKDRILGEDIKDAIVAAKEMSKASNNQKKQEEGSTSRGLDSRTSTRGAKKTYKKTEKGSSSQKAPIHPEQNQDVEPHFHSNQQDPHSATQVNIYQRQLATIEANLPNFYRGQNVYPPYGNPY